jgi:hypothetical protein
LGRLEGGENTGRLMQPTRNAKTKQIDLDNNNIKKEQGGVMYFNGQYVKHNFGVKNG